MALNKSTNDNFSLGFDSSILLSSSPFYSTSSSSSSNTNPSGLNLSDQVPPPPPSPRSFRSKKPLSITCPAPVRQRSTSDCNDLPFEVAESVLLTPTARSPATTFRKGGIGWEQTLISSPSSRSSSRRNSLDSTRGSLTSTTGGGASSVTSSVGKGNSSTDLVNDYIQLGCSVLDADIPFSMDENDSMLNAQEVESRSPSKHKNSQLVFPLNSDDIQ